MTLVEGDQRGDGEAAPIYFDDFPSWQRAVTQVFPWAADSATSDSSNDAYLRSLVPDDLRNILSNATSRLENPETFGSKDEYIKRLSESDKRHLDKSLSSLKTWRTMIDALGWGKTYSKLVFEKMIDRIMSQDLVPDIVEFGYGTGSGETFRTAVIYSNPIEATAFQRKIATPLLLNGFDILHQVQNPSPLYHGSSRGGPSIQAVFAHELSAR